MISIETVKRVTSKGGIHLHDIEPLGSGRDWDVFKVKWVSDDDRVLRIRRGPIDPILCEVGEASHTLAIQSRPDYSYHICDYVEGESIESRYEGNPTGAPSNAFEYLPSLATTLNRLHAKGDVYKHGFAARRWYDHVTGQLGESLAYVSHHGLFNEMGPTPDPSTLYWQLADLEPNPSVLLHGDLSPRNVILKPNSPEVSGLIDWDTAHYGDYMWDLAGWATFNDHAPNQFDVMLRLYHGLGDEPVHHALRHRFWVYFACEATRKLALLHRLGYTDLNRARRRVEMGLASLRS